MKAKILAVVLILSGLFVIANKNYAECGNQSPVAILTVEPEYVVIDCNATLDANDSYDPDGSIVKYEWDFTNDGTYDYNETSSYYPDGAFDGKTTHAYSEPDTYTVLLRVTDNNDATDTDTSAVYVVAIKNVTQDTNYSTIQAAIDDANDGDTIEVPEGTYYENIDFKGKAITLTSTNPNDWDVTTGTIIDADDSDANVVAFDSGENASSVLTGFTLTGGRVGIDCNSSSPTITKCVVSNNDYCGLNCSSSSSPTVGNCIIANNSNYAVRCSSSSPAITSCTIVNHDSYGIYDSSGQIKDCILWNNGDDLYNCSATYSCIEDGDSGTGNISSYPYFLDPDSNDFHLTLNSPCINRGDPNGDYTGQTDIDGDDRVIDGRVDMGADELNREINLVKNPGFEILDPNAPNYADDWSYYLYGNEGEIDSNGYDGNSLKMIKKNSSGFWVQQTIGKLIPGEEYVLSAMYKTSITHKAMIYLWPLSFFNHEQGNNDWMKITKFFRVPLVDGNGESTENHIWKLWLYGGWSGDPNDAIWYDDVKLSLSSMFSPAYGCINEPNVVKTIDFGSANDEDPNYNGGITWDVPWGDPNRYTEGGITYRIIPANCYLYLEIPGFNLDPNDPNFPATPMLLEVMFKDEQGTSGDGVTVRSGIFYPSSDPCIPLLWKEYYRILEYERCGMDKWKYVQHAFRINRFTLLHISDGCFKIRINPPYGSGTNLPIDYVSLRAISQDEYLEFANKQRQLRGFYESPLPPDQPVPDVNYADPNITVFVRDIMRPVYSHTKPDANEPNSISVFSALGVVEPLSFSIYSEDGVNDLTFEVSDFNCGGSNIPAGNISIFKVVYDEKRLAPFSCFSNQSYAPIPDRLEEFSSLSIDPNTSQRIWLKVQIPNDMSSGLYSGQIDIKQGETTVQSVNVEIDVPSIQLDPPGSRHFAYSDPYYERLCSDPNQVFKLYRETDFDCYTLAPYPNGYQLKPIVVDGNIVDFDVNDFKNLITKYKEEGFAKDTVYIQTVYTWLAIYKEIYGTNSYSSDDYPDLYDNLTAPDFNDAFQLAIEHFLDVANDVNMTFIFSLNDEPSKGAYKSHKRLLADRLYRQIRDANGLTWTTYSSLCDQDMNVAPYDTPNDINIPPLTDLIDYKIWDNYGQGQGYVNHCNDPNYGNFGYSTGCISYLRNPIYNRFLHGLFAFRTDAAVVTSYAMGGVICDPFNDFDHASPTADPAPPDWLLAYPTWDGKLLPTMALEGIREGIKDAKYIATLERLIAETDPNDLDNPNVIADANDYLDDVWNSIDPNFYSAYPEKSTYLGFYRPILEDISDSNDPNDFEAFTKIRKNIADYIIAIDPNY